MRTRVSIRAVMGLVLLAAVGVAALRSASELWASALFTLTLGLLAIASLGAAFLKGRDRSSYAGAAAFGWGYMLLAFGPWAEQSIRPRLVSTRLLDALYSVVDPVPAGTVRVWEDWYPGPRTLIDPDGRQLAIVPGPAGWWYSPRPFQDVGHSLTASALALFGCCIARAFAARCERGAVTAHGKE